MELRTRLPDLGVLVLSQRSEAASVLEVLNGRVDGVGYLLKERVADVGRFIDAVSRVAAGGTALDPEVVARMLVPRWGGPFAALTERERTVLATMAEGKSNRGIAEALYVTEATVEKHVTAIFRKLGINTADTEHRRVHAVLAYVQREARLAGRT